MMPAGQPDRAQRLIAAIERDGATCVWCAQPFGDLVMATTEHVVPRVKGGPSWLANEVAACRRCNRERGHVAPAAWLAECRRRGWQPDLARVIDRLTELRRTIDERGGQRRARPYIAAQLRRLERH
jgi:HNH endonuclease